MDLLQLQRNYLVSDCLQYDVVPQLSLNLLLDPWRHENSENILLDLSLGRVPKSKQTQQII